MVIGIIRVFPTGQAVPVHPAGSAVLTDAKGKIHRIPFETAQAGVLVQDYDVYNFISFMHIDISVPAPAAGLIGDIFQNYRWRVTGSHFIFLQIGPAGSARWLNDKSGNLWDTLSGG
jgi:hypothetical protein